MEEMDPRFVMEETPPAVKRAYDPFRSEASWDWPRYLCNLGKAVLVIGTIISLVLVFTIVFTRSYLSLTQYEIEFSMRGLLITVGVLMGTLMLHAVFHWLARMLYASQSIMKHMLKGEHADVAAGEAPIEE